MKGGSLVPKELKDFLTASYIENAPEQIDGYTLDNKLSNLFGKVYVNQDLKKVVVAFRGTAEASDWLNNGIWGISGTAYKLTSRFKTAKQMNDAAKRKYKGYQFELVGHSQSGILVNELCSKVDKNCISLNPAYKAASLKDNEYIIRSSGDVVSALSASKKLMNQLLFPSFTATHMITIPAKTSNPLKEHEITILDRLDQNKKIGRGGSKCTCEDKRPLGDYILNVCPSTL
jgi:hypothetical protein